MVIGHNFNCDLFYFVVSNTSLHQWYNSQQKQSGLSQNRTLNHVDAVQNKISDLPAELL